MHIETLLFIYDGVSGDGSAHVDAASALNVNGCALCRITHHGDEERDEWSSCSAAMGIPIRYLHLDDMPPEVAAMAATRAPCILAEAGGRLHFLVDRGTIERCNRGVHDLRGRIAFHAARAELELPTAV
jgi:hypothetical protein